MEINATLIAQGCNFFVAYLLVKNILLRPAIAQINEEQDEQERVQKSLAKYQHKIHQLQAEEARYRRACRIQLGKDSPVVMHAETIIKAVMPLPDAPELGERERSALRTEISQYVVTEVERG